MRRNTVDWLIALRGVLLMALCLSACSRETPNVVQGYVEADFVYVASPDSGRLENLAVQRGDAVEKGQLLFELEAEPEKSQADEAYSQYRKTQKHLDDLQKGLRPTEIEALEQSLKEARANFQLADIEFKRRKELLDSGTISKSEYDVAQNKYDSRLHQVKKIESELTTARLGSRDDVIKAASSEVKAAKASLQQARWKLNQKKQVAEVSAVVFDTLYREGEWIPAGRPAVSLLPPENKKVRFYVPQEIAGRLSVGQTVSVFWDGCPKPVSAVIRFISPQVEYTPPIIYSSRSRAKLVIMIEAFPQDRDLARLHPGQPVDVVLPAGAQDE